jgi:uncharacterized protein YjdB
MKRLTALAALLVGAACGGDSVSSPTRNADELFWAVRLNHTAVTLAVGQSLQLSATPITPTGAPITNLGNATFQSIDTMMVKVDANGLVTAHAAANGVMVIASIQSTEQNLTNADTVWVNVTSSAMPVVTFSIQPPDSAILAVGEPKTLSAVVKNGDGDDVPGLSIRYGSSDPGKLAVNPFSGQLSAKGIGKVKIWATSTSYGQAMSDTVEMTVTYPIRAWVSIEYVNWRDTSSKVYLANRKLRVRKGAKVEWDNWTYKPLQVTFENPAAVAGGNIPLFVREDGGQARQFHQVGTFKFTIPEINDTGEIVVVP